jgi:hypothetical protein
MFWNSIKKIQNNKKLFANFVWHLFQSMIL